jgi:type I restriction enzyme R subunit
MCWSICLFFPEKELLKSEFLDLIVGDKLTLLKRKKKGDTFLKKILYFIETYINGMIRV